MQKGRILIVDDDAFFRAISSDILLENGFTVRTASSGREAVSALQREGFDIVLTDLIMPDMDGIGVLRMAKQIDSLIDVILVTSHGSVESAIEALKYGAMDYIRKPLNADELLHSVNAGMEKKALLEENQEMRRSIKLFEIGRAITATIEQSRLFSITLDAMIQVVPADAGLFLVRDAEKSRYDIKAVRNLSTLECEKILSALESDGGGLGSLSSVTVLSDSGLKGRPVSEVLRGHRSALAAPVSGGGTASGLILALLRSGANAISQTEIKSASFIAEHASIAFENAVKYSAAREMAFLDSLTGLYNAKYLEGALERETKRADRLMMPLTVLFLDIDNFKSINDSNDHLVGSKVLVEMAGVLIKSVREVDTVVRYGGDEFVIILVDAGYEAGARVAERVREAIELHPFLSSEGLDLSVTASIGIATYPIHAKDKHELLKLADKAMYRAKDLSKNLVCLAPVPPAQSPEQG